MTKFKIEYFDPKLKANIIVEKEFFDTASTKAQEWALDWAYSAADKHFHKVTQLTGTAGEPLFVGDVYTKQKLLVKQRVDPRLDMFDDVDRITSEFAQAAESFKRASKAMSEQLYDINVAGKALAILPHNLPDK